ncbi:MarC family protein [Paludisphaera rhizosphaerae]|uniref:MarC family protein n=1 Tax=Paludisphaera rhizosphaerae TaxID=2711216 RepID=UPI0013EC6F44|nr:MarC family protein [Paludisphaera rhizosphaerae]
MGFNPWEIALLLFATIGPLKVTIIAASLTAGAKPEFVRRVALRSVVTASIVCVVFALFGEAILRTFKVSIPAFQIGGGLIVLLFAIDTAVSKRRADPLPSEGADPSSLQSLEIATCPLAVPLMASVSGLVAIVSTLAQRDDLKAVLFLTFVIAVIMAVNYACLCSCQWISRILGSTVIEVVSKLMGVLLAALAVELIVAGLVGFGVMAAPSAKPDSRPPEAPAPHAR